MPKKENPAETGLCRLNPDIRNRSTLLAEIQRIPVIT